MLCSRRSPKSGPASPSHPLRRVQGVGVGWNPWRVLRALEHVTLVIAPLTGAHGAVHQARDGAQTIVLDDRLTLHERNATLTHELVHLERGVLPDDTPAHFVAKEERAVGAEAARRLIGDADLARLHLRAELDAMCAWEAAEELDVPLAVLVERLFDDRR